MIALFIAVIALVLVALLGVANLWWVGFFDGPNDPSDYCN